MDSTLFLVVGASAVLILVPWASLRSLKAGPIEFTLDQPEVTAAISGLQLPLVQDRLLRDTLESSAKYLPSVRGSRVLWIDDRPEKVIAVRRLMRALGIEVVCANSSDSARSILSLDADFDLLITDVQRPGRTHEITGGVEIHEGTNFVVWLRSQNVDPVTRQMPVAFYAAYDWERLVQFTEPARRTLPEPTIANEAADFLDKVIRQLVKSRSTPLSAGGTKEATSP